MKKIFVVIGIAAILIPWDISPAQNAGLATGTQIFITEVGVKEPTETEWVEIYNAGTEAVDLTDAKFFEDSANHGLTAFRGSAVLAAGEFAVIANKADKVAAKFTSYTGTIFDSSWSSLKESGEEIGLKKNAQEFYEKLTYPAHTGTNETSLERVRLDIDGSDSSAWRVHPDSHTMGSYLEVDPNTAPPTDLEQPVSTATPTQSPLLPSLSFPVTNQPPQAIINLQRGSLTGPAPLSVNFDSRSSFDPDRGELSFLWNMGDGTLIPRQNPGAYTYKFPGVYNVRLTVKDNFGAEAFVEEQVRVLASATKEPVLTAAKKTIEDPKKKETQEKKIAAVGSDFLRDITSQLGELEDLTIEIKSEIKFTKKSGKEKPTLAFSVASPKTPAQKSAAKNKNEYTNGDRSDTIEISEIFPLPESTGQEWIELYNRGQVAVNLGNWMLADKAKAKNPYRFSDAVSIAPGEYLVMPQSETKINLNARDERVVLADFSGTIVDDVSYEAGRKEHAYAKLSSETGPLWTWSSTPTPGESNPAVYTVQGTIDHSSENFGALTLTTPAGKKEQIFIDDEVVDPLIGEEILAPGTAIDVTGQYDEKGVLHAHNIDGVQVAVDSQEKKIPSITWPLIVFLSLATALLNGIPWYKRLREKRRAS